MFQTKTVEKKTQIVCSITLFSFENRGIYEIMWNNIVEPDRLRMSVWRLHIACWIPNVAIRHVVV